MMTAMRKIVILAVAAIIAAGTMQAVTNLGSKPGLLHCRQILYQLSHKGSPGRLLSPWGHKESDTTERIYFKEFQHK